MVATWCSLSCSPTGCYNRIKPYKTVAVVHKVESNVTREVLINCKCAGQTTTLRDRGGDGPGESKVPETARISSFSARRGEGARGDGRGQKDKCECDALRNSRSTGSRSTGSRPAKVT